MLNDETYLLALEAVERLMRDDPKPGSEQGRILECLVDEVMEFEETRFRF